jgi:hypothetical protein
MPFVFSSFHHQRGPLKQEMRYTLPCFERMPGVKSGAISKGPSMLGHEGVPRAGLFGRKGNMPTYLSSISSSTSLKRFSNAVVKALNVG